MGRVPRLIKNATPGFSVSYVGQISRILFAAALLFVGGGVTALILWQTRDRNVKPRVFTLPVGGSSSHFTRVEVPDPPVLESLVREFLAARSPEDLAPRVRGSSQRPEDIVAKLAGLEAGDGRIHSIRYRGPIDSLCMQLESVLVNFSSGHNRVALLSPDAGGKWRVDFDAFDRHVVPAWDALLSNEVLEGTVRVFVSADNYYNGRYTEEDWVCFSMASPEHETIMFGYVPRDSRQLAALISALRRNGQGSSVPMQRMTLDIRHTGTGENRLFEITRVLADDWALGSQPFQDHMVGKFDE